MKQLGLIGRQTSFDIAQRFAPSQLCEGQDAKQLGIFKRARAPVTAVPLDNATESLPWHKPHQLCEQCLADVHHVSGAIQPRR